MITMRLIKQTPLATRVYKTFFSLVHGRANRKILEQLKNTPIHKEHKLRKHWNLFSESFPSLIRSG